MRKPQKLMILIAGPYRTGTNDEPTKIENNLLSMELAAMEVFNIGHLPVIGEWFALPLIKKAGSTELGDDIFNKIFHPISEDILGKCDAVYRVGGYSVGAELMLAKGKEMGKLIFSSINDIKEYDKSVNIILPDIK